MQKILKTSFYCIVIASLGACTPVVAQRGNLVENYQLEQLTPGESTRSDVLKVLGSPTTQSTFNQNVWYYIGQETEKKGILDPEITLERVLIVTFNEEGIVQGIEDSDGSHENIPYARDKTATHGNELTLMQQLLGNVGRFNAPQEPIQ